MTLVILAIGHGPLYGGELGGAEKALKSAIRSQNSEKIKQAITRIVEIGGQESRRSPD